MKRSIASVFVSRTGRCTVFEKKKIHHYFFLLIGVLETKTIAARRSECRGASSPLSLSQEQGAALSLKKKKLIFFLDRNSGNKDNAARRSECRGASSHERTRRSGSFPLSRARARERETA